MIMNKVMVADLQMLFGAFCFGVGFIGQRAVSIEGLGPMSCNAIRFSLSAIFLIVALPWIPAKYLALAHTENDDEPDEENGDALLTMEEAEEHKRALKEDLKASRTETWSLVNRLFGPNTYLHKYYQEAKKTSLFWGVFLGVINFAGSGLQQWGITLTSANKVAFIAGFDLFLTPILALFIPTFKRNAKPTFMTWVSVSIAMVGLYMLSGADWTDMEIGPGEKLTLISTIFWTLHITYTDIATSYINGIQMMIVQLIVVSVLSGALAILLEPQAWLVSHVLLILPWILFVAVAEGVGFTLMAMGQTYAPATHAALLLSLEGVFASVFSYFVLGETLTAHELCGCALMLYATYLAKMGCPCAVNANNPMLVSFNDTYHKARVFLSNLVHSAREQMGRRARDAADAGSGSLLGMEASPVRPSAGAMTPQQSQLQQQSGGAGSTIPATGAAGAVANGASNKGRHHLNPNALLI